MHSIRLRTLLIASGLALLLPMGPTQGAQNGTPVVLVGAGTGGGLARELRVADGSEVASGLPWGPAFTGGVRVAVGDVNGDGVPDRIVGSGPGAAQIQVYSGHDDSILANVFPFGPAFTGGVYVAAGDVDGDGRADIIAGAGAGSGIVSVLSGAGGHVMASGFPFGSLYSGGVTVAAGDVDGDGRAEIVVGTAIGGAVHIVNSHGTAVVASGFPYGPLFLGGVNVAAGDVNGDGRSDVITAPRTLGANVRVFNGLDISVLADFTAFPGAGGVTVAAGDVNGDGRADIVTGSGPGGAPEVRIFDARDQQLLAAFFAFDPTFTGGVFVATDSAGASLRFTSAPAAVFTAGQPGTFNVTASGGAGTTITMSGALPSGVTFTDEGNGRARLAGTPAPGTGGLYPLAFSASRGGAASATQHFTLTIREALALTSPNAAEWHVNREAAFRVTTSGFPRPALSSSGGWPQGVTFADQGDGSAVISGIASTTGTFGSTITASNALGDRVTQTFTLTVGAASAAPVAGNDAYVVNEGATLNAPEPGVLANDADSDSSLTVDTATITAPAHASTFTLNADGSFVYTHDGSETTSDSFSYRATDGTTTSSVATVAITVTPVNDPPQANADAASINEDAILNVSGAGVLANDTDGDAGDTKTLVAVDGDAAKVGNFFSTSQGALLTVNANGSYSYNPTSAVLLQALATGQQTTDTFAYTMRDSAAAESGATVTITVTGVNDVPLVAFGIGSPSFAEGGAPVAIAPNLTLFDPDDSTFESATVQITENYQNGQDVLAFTNQLGIAGNWDPASGILTLSGPAPGGSFVAALHSVTYANISQSPNTATRNVRFTINDGEATSPPSQGNGSIAVGSANDLPAIDLDADDSGGTPGADFAIVFTENNPAMLIEDAADATIADVDGTTLTSLTVRLTNLLDPAFETLDVDFTGADPAFSKAFDTTTTPGIGVLTITASPAQPIGAFEAILRTVTYRNTDDNPDLTPRVITVAANDGAGVSSPATATVTIAAANDTPMAVNDTGTTNEDTVLTVNAATGVLANDDLDGGGDSRTVVGVNGSAGNVGAQIFTGKGARLTVDADGAYIYEPTHANATGTLQILAPGQQTTDTFTYTMEDAGAVQSTATVTITVTGVNDPPRVVIGSIVIGGPVYTEDAAPILVVPIAQVSDLDDTTIESATAQITGNYQNGQDVLAFTNQLGITGNWDAASGLLTLTGPAAATDFETALRTVTYVNTSQAPNTTARTVTITASDGDATGSSSGPFQVASVNDAPAIAVTGGTTLAFTEGNPAAAIDTGIEITDPEDDNIDSATVQITGNYQSGVDVLNFTAQFGITGGFDVGLGRLALIGSATRAQYMTVLESVTFFNGSNTPSAAPRTVSWIVNDGDAASAAATNTIVLTPVNSSPVVNNESFDVLGNTELRVDLPAGPTPHVSETTSGPSPHLGLLDNDTDIDGTLTIAAIGNGCGDASAPFDCALADGAVVHVEADGAFSYTPAPGATTGTLNYTASDGSVTAGGTATFTIAEMVWYTKNDAPPGNGTSIAPFNSLIPLNAPGGGGDADDENDYVFVYFGDGTNNGQDNGLELEVGQHLLGEFNGLSIAVNLNGNGSPTVLLAPPSQTACDSVPCRPLITHSAGNAVTATEAIPREIAGFRLLGGSGGNAIELNTDAALTGPPALTIRDNVIEGAGEQGLDLRLFPGTDGTLDLRVENNAWNPTGGHGGSGVDIRRDAGTLNLAFNGNTNIVGVIGVEIASNDVSSATITSFAGNSIHGDALAFGLAITGVTFDAVPGLPIEPVDGDTLIVGSSDNPVFQNGIFFQLARGSLFFDDLDVFADNGGLLVEGPSDGGFALAVEPAAPDGTGTSSITAFAGMFLQRATIDLRLQNVSCPAGGNCVSLNAVAGVFRAAPGSTITKVGSTAGPEDAAVYIDNSAAGATELTVQYEGTITNLSGAGHAVIVNNADSGSAISFTGSVTDATGFGSGVLLTGNAGATIAFTGGLTLSTGANAAFTATGGGTVTVVDPAGAPTNTIMTTTGRALNVSNTTIGAGHLTFERISSGEAAGAGPVNGINLDTTGILGGLIVTGNGGPCDAIAPTCSGGTIQSSTGDAIRLVSTQDVSLTRMRIFDNDTNGIYSDELTNFSLANSVVTDNDVTDPGPSEAGIKFNELYGTASITDTVVRGTKGDNIRLEMGSGTLNNFTISNSTVGPTSPSTNAPVGVYSNGLSILTGGSGPTITATVSNSTFTGVDITRQQESGIFTVINAGTTTLSVIGNDFDQEGSAISLSSNGPGVQRFHIDDNDIEAHRLEAIRIGGTAVMDGTVNNNRVGSGALDSGSQDTAGIAAIHSGNATWTLAVTNNSVRNTETEGIVVLTGAAPGDTGTVDLTVSNNTVFPPDDNNVPLNNPNGMWFRALQSTTLCANIANNESQGNGTGVGYRVEKGLTATFHLQGFVAGGVPATLAGNNNHTASGPPTVNAIGSGFTGCTATPPSFP